MNEPAALLISLGIAVPVAALAGLIAGTISQKNRTSRIRRKRENFLKHVNAREDKTPPPPVDAEAETKAQPGLGFVLGKRLRADSHAQPSLRVLKIPRK